MLQCQGSAGSTRDLLPSGLAAVPVLETATNPCKAIFPVGFAQLQPRGAGRGETHPAAPIWVLGSCAEPTVGMGTGMRMGIVMGQ